MKLSPYLLSGIHFYVYAADDPEVLSDADGTWIEAWPCPVCGEEADSIHQAADCCLWKNLDWPTRYRIARAIENGSTWAEELGARA